MKDSIVEWLSCLKNFIDLDIDLNDKENKQHLLMIIESIENDLEEWDE